MIEKRKNYSILLCVVSSIFVVFKMYTDNPLFLWFFILFVMTAMLLAKQQHRLDYLLFFISWVYVIKFELTGHSLFVVLSFFYIVLSIGTLFLHKKRISTQLVLTYVLFVFFAVGATLFSSGNVIEAFGFVLNYSVIFFAVLFIDSNVYYRRYTYVYAAGLLCAAIVRWVSFSVPAINHFIESMTIVNTVKTTSTINTRFTGLDLDPNYFSLQILIAIACLVVLYYYNNKLEVTPIVLILILSIFGVFTYSKMFIITLITLILLTFIMFIKNNVKTAIKFASFIVVMVSVSLFFLRETIRNLLGSLFWRRNIDRCYYDWSSK